MNRTERNRAELNRAVQSRDAIQTLVKGGYLQYLSKIMNEKWVCAYDSKYTDEWKKSCTCDSLAVEVADTKIESRTVEIVITRLHV